MPPPASSAPAEPVLPSPEAIPTPPAAPATTGPTPAELAGRDAQIATNAFNTFLSTLNGWENMSDVQRAAAVVNFYNSIVTLSGDNLPTSGLGNVANGLNLISALESGNYASAIVSGLQLADSLTQGVVTDTLGKGFIPLLNLALAVNSGNPYSMVSSALATYGSFNAAAAAWTGPVGFLVAIVGLAVMGGERTPISGWSEVTLDENGRLVQSITHSREGGGEPAQQFGSHLLTAFQEHLDQLRDEHGQPLYTLNPARMPQVGYWYAPDGMQYQGGEGASMVLRWVDARGETVTRFYDAQGNRADGSNENIAQDFARYAQAAIVPSWVLDSAKPEHEQHLRDAAELERQAQALQNEANAIAPRIENASPHGHGGDWEPPRMLPSTDPERYNALGSHIDSLHERAIAERAQAERLLATLPQMGELGQKPLVHTDGTRQSIEVLTVPVGGDSALAVADPAEGPRQVLLDLDGDGYLEKTDWVRPDQALLGIDLNADGRLDGPELLSANLRRLDANGDGRLDARDPVFRAIRLWHDANGDGQTQGARRHADGTLALTENGHMIVDSELRSLPDAGISAIVYGEGKVSIERSDGSVQSVEKRTIEGDVLGVRYAPAPSGAVGVIRTDEQPDGNGVSTIIAGNLRPPTQPAIQAPPPPPPAPSPASPRQAPPPPPPPHVNHNPVASDDEFAGLEDMPFEISVAQLLSNDWDEDTVRVGDVLRVISVDSPVNGSVQMNGGLVVFRSYQDFFGEAQFRYTISDGRGGTASATAFLHVKPVNDAPVIDEVVYDTGPNRWAMKFWDGDPYHYKDPTVASGRVIAHDIDSPGALSYGIDIGHAPKHGHASIDAASGVWNYRTELLDPYVGADSFTVRVTDSGGASSWVNVETSHVKDSVSLHNKKPIGWNPPPSAPYASSVNPPASQPSSQSSSQPPAPKPRPQYHEGFGPVVVDLGDDGLDLLDATVNPVHLDFNGDGVLDQLGWVAPSDAFLVVDIDRDGRITQLDEISFLSYWPGALTDLEGLQAFDTNGDGILSAEDERWADFGLFRDLNSNGVQDEGEFTPIAQTGITSISLHREGEPTENQGNVVWGTSRVQMADGSTRVASDVTLRVIDGASAHQALETAPEPDDDPEQAAAAQQAQLFNAWSNTDPNGLQECPLGFVPSSGAMEMVGYSNHDAANSALVENETCPMTGTAG
ncbi:Ig-like domain-containing protein [Ottowia sp. VDI28]|uniref:Ig-like domain-containing protein n=1 Tax=Ottowia sp. VDI28 TaxID=3133968 RepID=UPI003C2DA106